MIKIRINKFINVDDSQDGDMVNEIQKFIICNEFKPFKMKQAIIDVDEIKNLERVLPGRPWNILKENLFKIKNSLVLFQMDAYRSEHFVSILNMLKQIDLGCPVYIINSNLSHNGLDVPNYIQFDYFLYDVRVFIDMLVYDTNAKLPINIPYSDEVLFKLSQKKIYYFNCLNNNITSPDRFDFINEMVLRGLHKKMLFSCRNQLNDFRNNPDRKSQLKFEDIEKKALDTGISNLQFDFFSDVAIGKYRLDADFEYTKKVSALYSSHIPFTFIENSYFAIVTETYTQINRKIIFLRYGKYVDCLFLTEKTYRTLAIQPFIIWARPYTLKYLKSMGFKTFPEIFDESYDNELDDSKRMKMILDEVERILSWSEDEAYEKYIYALSNVIHNQRVLKSVDVRKVIEDIYLKLT